MEKKDPICFTFVVSDWEKSESLLADAINGHSGFDFASQKHGETETTTIEDCEPNGIFSTSIPMAIETRSDGQYLVFYCTIPDSWLGRDVAIFIPPSEQPGFEVENDIYNGIVHITNSAGDQYWFYF